MSVLGYTTPSVSATNQLFNIVAIPSGVWRYIREGRMVWPLTWVVIIATLPGVLIGAIVRVRYLPDPRSFKLFAAGVLLYIGVRMVVDLLGRRARTDGKQDRRRAFPADGRRSPPEGRGRERRSARGGGAAVQPDPDRVRVLRRVLFVLHPGHLRRWPLSSGSSAGSTASAAAPSWRRSSSRSSVCRSTPWPGAALMGTLITSVAGVAFYSWMGVGPDWVLGLLFGLGGAAGMYCGARAQKFVPARAIKIMLCLVIIVTAIRYVVEFLRA